MVTITAEKDERVSALAKSVAGMVCMVNQSADSIVVMTKYGIIGQAGRLQQDSHHDRFRWFSRKHYSVQSGMAPPHPILQDWKSKIMKGELELEELMEEEALTLKDALRKEHPPSMNRITCNCSAGCKSNRCSCKANQRPCHSGCGCKKKGCKCHNKSK